MRRWIMVLIVGIGLAAALLWWQPWQSAPSGGQQVVALDANSDVLLISADGSTRRLTAASAGTRRTQLTAAPDGRQIAYIEQQGRTQQLIVQDIASGTRTTVYDEPSLAPFYLAWSPDSRWITFLASDLQMHLLIVPADGSATAHEITVGSPSYFAWSNDSARMLLHIGGTAPRGELFIYTAATKQLERLHEQPGDFQTPAWNNDGAVFYAVIREGARNRLTAIAAETTPLMAPTSDAVLFSMAPDQQRLAYVTFGSSQRSFVHVIAADGSTTQVLESPLPLAFFWSPDSRQIATIVPEPVITGPSADAGVYRVAAAAQPALPQVHWEVTDLASSTTQRFDPWVPSDDFLSLLPYFDQYATSLSLWSPDSTRLIYANSAGVWSLEVASGQLQQLSDGSQGFWVPPMR